MREYSVPLADIEALKNACTSADWSPAKHNSVVQRMSEVDSYADLRYVTQRDHFSAMPGRLRDEDGKTIAPDFRAWAQAQLDEHRGDVDALWHRFKDQNWSVTEWRWALPYYWVQTGAYAWDGFQVEVVAEQEFPGKRLFDREKWNRPMAGSDVLNRSYIGPALGPDTPFGPGRYRLESAIKIADVVRLGQTCHADYLAAMGWQIVVSVDTGERQTAAQLHPEAYKAAWPRAAPV